MGSQGPGSACGVGCGQLDAVEEDSVMLRGTVNVGGNREEEVENNSRLRALGPADPILCARPQAGLTVGGDGPYV